MRILHISDTADRIGGREIYLHRLMDALRLAGHTSALLTVAQLRNARTPGQVGEAIKRETGVSKWDAVELHSVDAIQRAGSFAKLAPTFAFPHDFGLVCPGTISWFRRGGQPCSLRYSPACLVNTYRRHCNSRNPIGALTSYWAVGRCLEEVRHTSGLRVASRFVEQRLRQGGITETPVHVVPYFVPLPAQGLGQIVSSDSYTVLFVGRVAEVKGLSCLLECLALLPERVQLVVVGDGYSMAECQALAEELGVSHRVRFLGWLGEAETSKWYKRCTVVVLPSLWPEPFGIVGLEAMASGKPVVGSKVGGIPEWLSDGETGYLVPPGDAKALSDRIGELLQQPDLRGEMGENGRRAVEVKFSPQTHVEHLVRILAS